MSKTSHKKKGKDLLYDMEKAYSPSEYYFESERRDIYYSALVKDIIENNRTSQCLKCIFFSIVCFIFVLTCVLGIMIIYTISQKETISYSDIGIALTGFGTVLSSIIVLPQIIAKHLFPEDSESVRFEFIKANQELEQSSYDDNGDDVIEEDNLDLDEENETE